MPRLHALSCWRSGLLTAALAAMLSTTVAGAQSLDNEQATRLSELALHCIHTEFPNKPGDVITSARDLATPSQLHPAFYGCYDWHSSVHGHWMLAYLLRAQPDLASAPAIRESLDRSLTRANLLREAAYFAEDANKSFERMYGWAWLLKLGSELRLLADDPELDDGQAHGWVAALAPLEQIIVERALGFLPKQTYAIRIGTHTNTAFGMTFLWDWAEQTSHGALRDQLRRSALGYFSADRNCPASWEPSGADFLSPCLEEAELMARVLETADFSGWLDAFLPELRDGGPARLLRPAEVSDRSDPQIVHLDGLNLSRAWAMYRIGAALGDGDPRADTLRSAARNHLQATLPHVTSGNYEGEHWLASFAVWALAQRP